MHEGSNDNAAARVDVAVVVGSLVLLNLAIAFLVDGWLAGTALVATALVLVAAARARGYTWPELGLGRGSWGPGLRWGLIAVALVAAAVTILALVPASRSFLDDDRFIDLGAGEVVAEAGLRIPLVTALGEELLFRSVLLAVLFRLTTTWRAVTIGAVLFGLWHVFTTLDDLGGNDAADDLSGVAAAGAVLGVVIATGVAGAAFSWLRLRSDSVVAPWLAHWAVNGSTFVAGAIVVGRGWV